VPTVTVEPDGKSTRVPKGKRLLWAVARAGVNIEAPCGGRGACGKCAVRVVSGELPPSERCAQFFGAQELDAGWRLACQVQVEADVVVEVPAERRIHGERILAADAAEFGHLSPVVFQVELEVPAPSLDNQRSDLDRLLGCSDGKLEGLTPTYPLLCGLPAAVREDRGRVVVTAYRRASGNGGCLMSVHPASKRPRLLGASFDVGTTTLVGEVWDLADGKRLALASRANPQRECGDDVISRSDCAARGRESLKGLQRLVAGGMQDILDECLDRAGASTADLHDILVAGNTVMTHLLFGITTENIAQSPFAPVFTGMREAPAEALGLNAAPGARVTAVPAISGYVGGDIVAGLLATGLLEKSCGPALFIDVGTNGEMVLIRNGQAIACSAAAGPAFEGARISHGMRAMSGAIEDVALVDDELVCLTIGGVPARGICGTGLIDAAAVLRSAGVLDETGRLLGPDESPGGLGADLSSRIHEGGQGLEVLLGEARSVPLTQKDLRELQLAKGAILAGARVLLKEAGLDSGDLERVVLGGAFGSYIDRASALTIGLIPQVPEERVLFAGNTSAAGARLALLDRSVRQRAPEVARKVGYLELSGRADFQELFAEAMLFPAEPTRIPVPAARDNNNTAL